MGRPRGMAPIEERFWQHVEFEPNSGCWLWTGKLRVPKHYGVLFLSDRREEYAHRVAYRLFRGPIVPPLDEVCHTCDLPRCVNPQHLFLGTHADNIADTVAKNRHAKGATCGTAKLSAADVQVIRDTAAHIVSAELGRRFGVSASHIASIRRGRDWRHLLPPGTAPITGWARGERNRAAKLTGTDVQAIRARYAAGGVSQSQLGREFGVSDSLVSGIVRGLKWTHINTGGGEEC